MKKTDGSRAVPEVMVIFKAGSPVLSSLIVRKEVFSIVIYSSPSSVIGHFSNFSFFFFFHLDLWD